MELSTELSGDREERIIDSKYGEYEKGNCSEKTFLIVHSLLETDIPADSVMLFTGFGGGIGGTRVSNCGAVSGGIAALGLKCGRNTSEILDDPVEDGKERAYRVSREFFCRFKGRFGSTICGELVGDLLRQNRYDSDERKDRCRAYILHAVKLCMDILSKE